MAMAVVKLNQKGDISEGVSDTIQYFLDRLYINRSGQRLNIVQKQTNFRKSLRICFHILLLILFLQDFHSHADIPLQRFARTWHHSHWHGQCYILPTIFGRPCTLYQLVFHFLSLQLQKLFERWAPLTRSVTCSLWPTMLTMQLW